MRKLALMLMTASALAACAPKQYITVVAPKKTAAEEKTANGIAGRIFPITHERSLVEVQQELAKPEIQEKLRDMVTEKVDNSDLGECLTDHGFGDYFTQRMLTSISTSNVRAETIRLWVQQIPMDMFAKADRTFGDAQFKKTYLRINGMGTRDTRDKLNELVAHGELTDAEANEFFLKMEDRDFKSFLIITKHDGQMAIDNLLKPYKENPSAVILDFMQSHPAANARCSLVKGAPV